MTQSDSIVVFEPNFRGHRYSYCRAIVQSEAVESTDVILALTTEGSRSEEYELFLRDSTDAFTVLDLGSLPSINERGYFRWVRESLKRIRDDHPTARIVVLEGDKLLPHLLLSRLSRISRLTVLVMRMPESLGKARKAGARDAARFALARILTRLRVDVVALAPAQPRERGYRRGGIRATPDPIDVAPDIPPANEVRERFGLRSDRVWFGVFGNITPRKNVDVVANALSSAGAQRCGLLLAGRIAAEEMARCDASLSRFQSLGGEICTITGLLSDADLDALISAVDLAVLAHSSDGPSGIMGKAAALGTRNIAAGAKTLRDELARTPQLGTWVPLSESALSHQFTLEIASAGDVRDVVDMATGDDFAAALISRG